VETGAASVASPVDVSATPTVRAAGGIVYRRAPDGEPKVLLVHRPRYDDWSLPKGKADPGERDEDTALREVEDETGLRCLLGDRAGETRYRDSKGRNKIVQYWLMEPESMVDAIDRNAFVPNAEVDEVRWCTVTEAIQRLSYAHDRELLQRVPVPG
jgi:8-oxo-dGTP pyrophosphatase MutT (NUDIX family)